MFQELTARENARGREQCAALHPAFGNQFVYGVKIILPETTRLVSAHGKPGTLDAGTRTRLNRSFTKRQKSLAPDEAN